MGERVMCTVKPAKVEGPTGKMIPGVEVRCTECGATQQAAGTQAKSVRRCLAQLRENCDETDENYYVTEKGEDQD